LLFIFFWVHLCMHRIDLGFGGRTQKHGVWYMWVQFYSYYHHETCQSFKHEDMCIWDSISSHHYVHICIYFLLLLFRIVIIFFLHLFITLSPKNGSLFSASRDHLRNSWLVMGLKAQIVSVTYTQANGVLYI